MNRPPTRHNTLAFKWNFPGTLGAKVGTKPMKVNFPLNPRTVRGIIPNGVRRPGTMERIRANRINRQQEKWEEEQFWQKFFSRQLLLSAICFIGFGCHFAVITTVYMSYDMVTEVFVDYSALIIPPAVTFCVDYKHIIRNNELDKKCTELYGFSDPLKVCSMTQLRLNSKNTHKYTLSFWEIVTRLYILETNEEYKTYDSGNTGYLQNTHQIVKEFIVNEQKCFTIQPFPDNSHLRYVAKGAKEVMSITFNGTAYFPQKPVTLFIHPSDQHIRGEAFNNFVAVKPMLHSTVTYSTLTRNKLPPPYPTKCINYTGKGLESQIHCLETCTIKKCVQSNNVYPVDCLIDEYMNVTQGEIKISEFYGECDKECENNDCHSVIHFPKLVSEVDKGGQFEVKVILPVVPEIIILYKEKMFFTDYIVYVTSILSLWFGFSFLASLEATVRYITFNNNIQTANIQFKQNVVIRQNK